MANEEVGSKQQKPENILVLDYLVDELLMEILCRIPDYKNVVTCKAVCKRWASLISRPSFIRRFVNNKVGKTNCAPNTCINGDEERMKMTNDRTFGLVVRKLDLPMRYTPENSEEGLMIRFNDPIYNPGKVSVSSLPRVYISLPHILTVVATCNDLVLYSKHRPFFDFLDVELCIGNAETRQYVELPSLHLESSARHIGFVCDPYYSNHTTNFTINDAYSASIFIILEPFKTVTEFSGLLLSAHTGGTWRTIVLSLPLSCRPAYCGSRFCIDRKYYFLCDKCIIAFDPFVDGNDVINCDSIPLPLSAMTRQIEVFGAIFGVFSKRLYMCVGDESEGTYRVWVLEDFKKGCWSFQHSITVQDWIPRNCRLVSLIDQESHTGKPISFHPTNPDIIYTISRRWIILCNLRTREIEIVSELPKGCQDVFPNVDSYEITLPVWPSPLPILGI